ncbi:MAG: Ig-like domain-containing protein [Bacteroidales bacterium]|nr:Ig-like domain-containing protein [Bacteroidales bacterium]
MNIKSTKTLTTKIKLYSFIAVILFTASCAKIVMPTGGEKDITPPRILKSYPENFSVNFKEKKVVIKFDEFFQLKNLNKELLVSPPLKEQPKIRVAGKNLIIETTDTLKEKTTYNINFHEAIADLNENNILSNYQYCFSTGDYIDSLYVDGLVLDAFSLEPKEFVKVMLYENYNDSTPYKKTPDFVSQTNKKGQFSINNIKSGNYHIFALNDANNNLLFDQPSEEIAFIDSLIIPNLEKVELIDTLKIIESIVDNDTIFKDTIIKHTEFLSTIKNLELCMFQEDYKKQYIAESKRDKKETCTFIFNKPSDKKCEISPLNFDTKSEKWNIIESNLNNDTIICWLIDSTIYKRDSLIFECKYNKKTILEQDSLVTDTVTFVYVEKEKPRKKRKRKDKKTEEPKKEVFLNIVTNIKNKIDLNQKIILKAPSPVKSYDASKIQLFLTEDSTEILQPITFTKDSIFLRTFCITNKWQEESNYKLVIYPKAFTDIYNYSNDTIANSFSTRESDYYGNINLDITNIDTNSIVQLLSDKEKLLRQYFISNDTSLNINYLYPKKYMLKLIVDKNNNKEWDTGNLLKNIQPEKIYYYKEIIEIKSNWDNEITWDVNK